MSLETLKARNGIENMTEPTDKEKLIEAEARIAELEERNQMLTDCILEMADIVYA